MTNAMSPRPLPAFERRYCGLREHAAAAALRYRVRWNPALSDADLDDAAADAVMQAAQVHHPDDDAALADVRRRVESALRKLGRRAEREAKHAAQVAVHWRADAHLRRAGVSTDEGLPLSGATRPRRAKQLRQFSLSRQEGQALAVALADYELILAHAVSDGSIARDAVYERLLYRHGIRIVEHAWELITPASRQIDAQLVEQVNAEVRADARIVMPGERVRELEGDVEALIDAMCLFRRRLLQRPAAMRRRGRPRKLSALQSEIGTAENVEALRFREHEAAAFALTTELLKRCGIDPDIKHLRRRLRDTAVARCIAKLKREHHAAEKLGALRRSRKLHPWWEAVASETSKPGAGRTKRARPASPTGGD